MLQELSLISLLIVTFVIPTYASRKPGGARRATTWFVVFALGYAFMLRFIWAKLPG